MKSVRKVISLLLVVLMTASLFCTAVSAATLSDLISKAIGDAETAIANGGTDNSNTTGKDTGSTLAAAEPSKTVVTITVPTGTTITSPGKTDYTADGTANPLYIQGGGGSLDLPNTAAATAYLFGDFSSAGTTITVGSGWTVYIGNADVNGKTVPTSVTADTSAGGNVYAIKASGGSIIHLESGKITANTVNSGASNIQCNAYGVYLDGASTLFMGRQLTTAYTEGAGIFTSGTTGDFGITALNGSTVYLRQGQVYSQGQHATAVYADNSSVTSDIAGVMGTQQDVVFYAHTANASANTALNITGTASTSVNWRITGCGAVFEGNTALSAAVASTQTGPLAGGTFRAIGGGTAIYTGGYGSIRGALAQNYYLRDDASGDYFGYSDGSRAVSDSGKTVSGTATAANAMQELNYKMGISGGKYYLPCDIELSSRLMPKGTHTLDLCGRNITDTGTGDTCTIEVPASGVLTLLDSRSSGYTNMIGTPAGVIRTASTGSAVKVDAGAYLTLGKSGAYGPMISGVDSSVTDNQAADGIYGILNSGSIVAYSCGVYGTCAGVNTQDSGGGSTSLVDVKASSASGAERAVFCGRSYGLRQTGGALNIAGGIFSLDIGSTAAVSKTAAAPWGLYVNYGTRTANAVADTAISGGYFYSVATDGIYNGRNLMLGDIMAETLSFTDNNLGVSVSSGSVSPAKTYKIAAPSVMHGDENATAKNAWDNYEYYGYAIYNGMADSVSQEYNSATKTYSASTRAFSRYFTVGDNSIYKTVQTTNKKICTCCGAEYTGTSCPNCTSSRCSVCGKCPNHCTCKNTSLVSDDHFAYITGCSNGCFKPTGTVTRAEAATILYRLMQNKNYISSKTFTDVNHKDWFYTAVSCLASKGVINGYTNGKFMPYGKVTRAEMCAMAARFYSIKETTIHFTDVPASYWAYKYIASAVAYGWINDSHGRYYPDQAMTRQEIVVFVNSMTGRIPDEYFINNNIASLTTFPDVTVSNAAYYQIIEAANGHTYVQTDGVETWKALK